MRTLVTPEVSFNRCDDYEAFESARAQCSRSAYLSPLTPDEFAIGDSYLSADGKCGYRIVNGDLQSVFNCSDVKGAGTAAVLDAIGNGARTLDCFDGFLPGYYRQFGFIEVSRDSWADEYAPADWDYSANGRPDVVYMRYHGGNPANLKRRLAMGVAIV